MHVTKFVFILGFGGLWPGGTLWRLNPQERISYSRKGYS